MLFKETSDMSLQLVVNKSLIKNLKKLSLVGRDFSPEILKEFAISLVDTKIVELDLSCNKITNTHLLLLLQELRNNQILKKLNLSYNCLGKNVSLFKTCHTNLKKIYLSHTELGDSGACEIAKLLEANSTIEFLDLASNEISDKGANAIALSLRKNVTCSSLQLIDNPLTENSLFELHYTVKIKNNEAFKISLSDSSSLNNLKLDFYLKRIPNLEKNLHNMAISLLTISRCLLNTTTSNAFKLLPITILEEILNLLYGYFLINTQIKNIIKFAGSKETLKDANKQKFLTTTQCNFMQRTAIDSNLIFFKPDVNKKIFASDSSDKTNRNVFK